MELNTTALDVRDRDAEQKRKAKLYADERRGAQYSKVDIGDTILLQQDKVDKFTTPFNSTPHKIVSKSGNQVVVESPTGVRYRRNTTHVKKFETQENKQEHLGQENTPEMEVKEINKQSETDTQTPQEGAQGLEMPMLTRPQRVKKTPQRLSDFVLK